jgi:cellulose biosynthesis protein BcsQ
MIETLALISGKGGSGKTTIALSLAQLLATCEKRVLLIDCDLSTHGATYFFESSFENIEKYVVFSEIMSSGHDEIAEKTILNVRPNFDFIPSHLDFTSEDSFNTTALAKKNFLLLIELIELKNYDFVIFDCQAGYSFITKIVTEYTKRNLAVLEADAISASSLRVLYSQLVKNLDSSRTFQVFNKISRDEFEIYSKIPTGTLFNNLTPILFDWTVRKAFAYSQLPVIDNANPSLTNSICTLAIELLPGFRNLLVKYFEKVKAGYLANLENEYHKLDESLKATKENEIHVRYNIKENTRFWLNTIIMLLMAIVIIVISLFDETQNIYKNITYYFCIVTPVLVYTISNLIASKKNVRTIDNNYESQSEGLLVLRNKIEETKQEIETLKSEMY